MVKFAVKLQDFKTRQMKKTSYDEAIEAKGEVRGRVPQNFFLGASWGDIPEICFRNVVCSEWYPTLRGCC